MVPQNIKQQKKTAPIATTKTNIFIIYNGVFALCSNDWAYHWKSLCYLHGQLFGGVVIIEPRGPTVEKTKNSFKVFLKGT